MSRYIFTVSYRREYCDGVKNYKILTDLHIFSTPEYENIVHMRKCCGGVKNNFINVWIVGQILIMFGF
jgi:hypothetical protein